MAGHLPVWGTIHDAWERFTDSMRVVLVYVGIMVAAQWIVGSRAAANVSDPGDIDLETSLLVLVLAVGMAWLALGMVRVALDAVRGEPLQAARLATPAGDVLRVIALGLLAAMPILFGMILLVVPGIYLCLLWSQAYLLILDKRAGVMESFRQSGHLTKDCKWRLLGISLLLALFSLLPQVIQVVTAEGSEIVPAAAGGSGNVALTLTRFVSMLLLTFLSAFNTFVYAAAYVRLLGRAQESGPPGLQLSGAGGASTATF